MLTKLVMPIILVSESKW